MSGTSVTPRPRPSIVARLIQACKAMEPVPKKGKNEEYDWLRAADVTRAFRKEVFKRGLLLVPDEQQVEERLTKNHAGLLMRIVRLKVAYTVHDARSNDKLGPFTAFGSGLDIGDKALNKAKTGALKFFIKNVTLLAEVGDDPEVDSHKDADASEPLKLKSRAIEYQKRAWAAATKEYGRTPQQCAAYLVARFKVVEVELLSRDEFDEAIRWVVGKSDPAEILELSVHSIESAKKNGESRGA